MKAPYKEFKIKGKDWTLESKIIAALVQEFGLNDEIRIKTEKVYNPPKGLWLDNEKDEIVIKINK